MQPNFISSTAMLVNFKTKIGSCTLIVPPAINSYDAILSTLSEIVEITTTQKVVALQQEAEDLRLKTEKKEAEELEKQDIIKDTPTEKCVESEISE